MDKLYRLLRPLKHRGINHLPGTELAFNEPTAKWLAEHGIISETGSIVYPTKSEIERAKVVKAAPKAPSKHAVRSGGCAGCGWKK